MYSAIIDNRVEFVELFLEHGFSIRNFITHRTLLMLYNDIPKTSLLYKLIDKEMRKDKLDNSQQERKIITFKLIGSVVESLVDYIYNHQFTQTPFKAIDREKTRKILDDSVKKNFNTNKKNKKI